jgi:hypothetical protein
MSTKTAITGLLFYQVLLFSTNQSVNAGLGYSPHQTSAIQTDVNSVPRSLIIVLHTPCFVNICVRPEATVIVSLLSIIVSANQSVNAGLGYSPHRIIFGVIVV